MAFLATSSLEGLGERISSTVMNSLKDLRINTDDSEMGEKIGKQVGEEVGEAVGKHVAATIESGTQSLKPFASKMPMA